MEFGYGRNGSGDDRESSDSRKGKKPYQRHSPHQTQTLEAFFKGNPHPDDCQRRQLGKELGLAPKQIKFWFQNKRTQSKAQSEKAGNGALRAENRRIECENLAIKEALQNTICTGCSGPPIGEEERLLNLQKLHMENTQLKREYERLCDLVGHFYKKPAHQIIASSTDLPLESFGNQGLEGPSFGFDLRAKETINHRWEGPSNNVDINSRNPLVPPFHFPEIEKSSMLETALSAMNELVKLFRVDEPLWIKSSIHGRSVLNRDSYEKFFPKTRHLRSSSARIESSKYSGVVMATGMYLVEHLLDPNKFTELFPTIVTKASTIGMFDTIMMGNQGASLQLMYQQMHTLSPHVAPREFYFLRYCQLLETGKWVVADVSYNISQENPKGSLTRSWRLPSGCMIQDMPNGYSRVTWIEHVEVDEKSQTHRLFRDFACTGVLYGAERWIVTLQRMCQRFSFSMTPSPPSHELGGVINLPEGRMSIIQLSQRMVKNFCAVLSMLVKLDFAHLSDPDNSGIRLSLREIDQPGQPAGMVVSATTAMWLPQSVETLFNFFRDGHSRSQWDVLSNGNPASDIAQISTGAHPGSCVSVLQPFLPNDNDNMVVLQESFIDELGAMVVYAPVDVPAILSVTSGGVSGHIPLLPSGFVICSDGRIGRGTGGASSSSSSCMSQVSGSLLTVVFQVLVPYVLPSSNPLNMESLTTVDTLITSTVQKIRDALNFSPLN